jgi:hypothetical protein
MDIDRHIARQKISDILANEPPSPKVLPPWRMRPTRAPLAIDLEYEDLCDKIDAYFEECAETGKQPMVAELPLAVGFDSFIQMLNHARRRGPAYLRAVSRSLSALQVGYEEKVQEGVKTATWMLERIPEFDSIEPQAQPPTYSMQVAKEFNVHVTGLTRPEETGKQLSAQEAYLQLIKHKSIEDLRTEVQTLTQGEDGTYSVVEIPNA